MKMYNLSRIGVFFLLLLAGLSGPLQAQLNLNDKLPIDPQVKVGRLSNGMAYYIRKNNRPENKVELRLVVNVGSILEEDNQQGLAHFTEHMAFNGSTHFKKNELVSFLQSIGVEFGADLNAYTGFDETVYILPVPIDKKENLEKAFTILEDWAMGITFDPAEIDKERGVVLEELRSRKSANDRMFKVYAPTLFEGTLYANRLPGGKEEIIKSFKPETVKKFYRDWYRPDLMAVVAVGDMEIQELENMIKLHFDKLKKPSKPRPRKYLEMPSRQKSEGLVVTDKEATNFVLQVYYSTQKDKPEVLLSDYRNIIARQLFTALLNQRMQELTQQPNPPFIFAGSSLSAFVRNYESYSTFSYLTQAGPEPAIKAIVQENERARKFGFTAAELDRAKKSALRNMERAFNEKDKTESEGYTEEYIRAFLENEPIPGIDNEFNYYKTFTEGITLEEINALAASIIPTPEKNKLVLLTGPEQAPFKMPTGEELLKMANQAAQANITPYVEKAVASSLMEKKPSPGKILREQKDNVLGTTTVELSNGTQVILKSTDFKNDQVLMGAFRTGGHYLYPDRDRFSAENAAAIVSQMGIGPFSPTDLRKVLAGKTVSVSPRIGPLSESMSGQSGAQDIESLLQLVHLYFTEPKTDEGLFTSFISKQQSMYQNIMSEPRAAFQDSVLRITYNNHPRRPKVPRSEDYGLIKLDRSMAIYKERFGNAHGFTFVFVGSFDANAIKPLLETYIGSLPSTPQPSKFQDIGLRPVKGIVKKNIYKGSEPKSFIQLSFYGETPYSNAENMKVQAMIEVLNIKLIETLREEMSGVYGAGASGSLNKNPYNSYALTLFIPCGPENVDKLTQAALGEVNKLKTNGPLDADLSKVKETWKQQYQENLKDNSYWLRRIQLMLENNLEPNEVVSYEKRVDALTTKDIKDVANKYFDMKNYIQIVLYPEKK